jgi:hypothetical protein
MHHMQLLLLSATDPCIAALAAAAAAAATAAQVNIVHLKVAPIFQSQ